MNRINPRVLGILIAAGGVCAALPFQKLTTRTATQPASTGSQAIEWRSNDFTLEVTAHGQPLTSSPYAEEPPKSPAFGGAGGVHANARASLDNVSPPPALAGAYEPGNMATPSADPNELRDPDGGTSSSRNTVDSKTARSTTPLPSVAIEHKITDGDTLEALAEKHLGSRLRWTEIYNANPEILNDPEVLPLGVTIVILPVTRRPKTTGLDQSEQLLVPVSRSDLQKFRRPTD